MRKWKGMLSPADRIRKDERIIELCRTGLSRVYTILGVPRFAEHYLLPTLVHSNMLYKDIADEKIRYSQAEKVKINASSCVRSVPEEIRPYLGEHQTDELFVSMVSDIILHDSGTVAMDDGRVLFDSVGGSYLAFQLRIQEQLERRPLSLFRMLRGRSFSDLIPSESQHLPAGFCLIREWTYYHWVLEFLPTLRALEACEESMETTVPIIVERNPPDWVIEYLSLAGFGDQVLPLPAETVRVDKLLLPRRRVSSSQEFEPSTDDLLWIKDRFGNEDSNREKGGSRLYVSREDADSRKLRNEEELIDGLSELGFEKLTLSNIPVREQIRMFSNAEFVVGPHGAGLANIVFSSDIFLLEILPDSDTDDVYYYYCLANQLGFSYDYVRGQRTEDDNLIVDVPEIQSRIRNLLE